MNLTTPALLFPALSLLLLAYTNRFLTLAGLIRNLCKERSVSNLPEIDGQIKNLRKRIYLIKYMQFLGIASLFFCVISMFFLFLNKELMGEIVFGISLVLMMASLGFSMREIHISVDALDIQLKSCK
ncbi:MAG TPA: DUF2721 domain-containing protein [Spirochaetota bacterium]|nr:DUF2721 domain-containing protein [Spirochaetota bacterium]